MKEGRDEMNLAEFPLASVSNRYLDGTKTVVFEDTVWDYEARRHLPRKLVISGSDVYGLPTAKDDDLLLACVQLSYRRDFASRHVTFSRYELIRLLRWEHDGPTYRRVGKGLRRLLGTSIFSNRAFYDNGRKSWVNKDFGIFDNLYVYEKEEQERGREAATSWLVWNEVLFDSFQANYIKKLDWDLYCGLSGPIAKRLYRFLDKRFYHANELEFDLRDLAFRKVRLSDRYKDITQIKRRLAPGITELEQSWDLKPLDSKQRFFRCDSGAWKVRFERERRQKAKPAHAATSVDMTAVEVELAKRNVGRTVAGELVSKSEPDTIRTAIEVFDWFNANGQKKGPGFLVEIIRNPGGLVIPAGFETTEQRRQRRAAKQSREHAEQKAKRWHEARQAAAEQRREEEFEKFWNSLGEEQRMSFETRAMREAESFKRKNYCRTVGHQEVISEKYRRLILRDHFEKTRR